VKAKVSKLILSLKDQNPTFSPWMGGKTGILRDYCRGKDLRSYIGFWALSEDINRSEEEQIIIRCSQLKSHK